LDYTPGQNAQTVDALTRLGHDRARGRIQAHVHERHESAFYFVSGDEAELWAGKELQHHAIAHAGDYLYIPARVAHMAVNHTPTPAIFVGARSDPNEQESVVLRPDLDARVP